MVTAEGAFDQLVDEIAKAAAEGKPAEREAAAKTLQVLKSGGEVQPPAKATP